MRRLWLCLTSVFLFICTNPAQADMQMNMTKGVTSVSNEIYNLHMWILWVCVGIGVLVFGVLIYSLIRHRKSRGYKAATFHEHPTVEIIWAVIPFIILVIMAIPATKVLIHMDDASDADLTVKVTGYQWKWQYEYLDHGVKFFSNLATTDKEIQNKATKGKWYLLNVDRELVLPTNKKIRFLITSNDVIHSWWVPALGVKKDGVPGFIHESWTRIDKPGVYRGQCAELCGVNHGFMPVVVRALPPAEFDAWLKKQKAHKAAEAASATKQWTKEELMARGEKAYQTSCAVCHKPDGSGMPPAFPGLKGSRLTVGPVKQHINIVLHGKTGTAMQAFGGQLSDADIAAIVTYERNAWGNDDTAKWGKAAGGIVQPKDVEALR